MDKMDTMDEIDKMDKVEDKLDQMYKIRDKMDKMDKTDKKVCHINNKQYLCHSYTQLDVVSCPGCGPSRIDHFHLISHLSHGGHGVSDWVM